MAASTTKKVLVRRFDRESLTGFVNPLSYLQPGGVELMKPDGELALVPYQEVKTVSFVRDFEVAEGEPERRVFLNRPKMDGLWVRMQFRDGEIMDGILSNNLLQLEQYGFTFIPPEPNSNRVFAPKEALRAFHVLGVVGSPISRRRKAAASKEQIGLFDQES